VGRGPRRRGVRLGLGSETVRERVREEDDMWGRLDRERERRVCG
jgi:hypothetical protein